jgi:hypothetical protein
MIPCKVSGSVLVNFIPPMKSVLASFAFLAGLMVCTALRAAAPVNTVTLSPWSQGYSPKGGTITLTVALNYSTAVTVPGFSFIAPTGWKYVSVAGPDTPPVAPQAGDEGELSFTYLNAPLNLANFSVTLSYPAGLTGDQVFKTVYAVFRPEQAQVVQPNFTVKPQS